MGEKLKRPMTWRRCFEELQWKHSRKFVLNVSIEITRHITSLAKGLKIKPSRRKYLEG